MDALQVLTLLLAASAALNIVLAAAITARHADASPAQAVLTAASTALALFLTDVPPTGEARPMVPENGHS